MPEPSKQAIRLGRVGVNPRGEYQADETYNRLDIVRSAGSGWICLKDGTSAVTPVDGENWMCFALSGGEIAEDAMLKGTYDTEGKGVDIFKYVDEKLADVNVTIQMDDAPAAESENAVKSSGIFAALSAKQDALTFDESPTSESGNPVESGGVFTALAGKADTNHAHPSFTGATGEAAGTAGMVPPPQIEDIAKFLSGNGQWADPPVTQYTLPAATESEIGGVKLYNATGEAVDGAVTQKAVTDALSTKLPVIQYCKGDTSLIDAYNASTGFYNIEGAPDDKKLPDGSAYYRVVVLGNHVRIPTGYSTEIAIGYDSGTLHAPYIRVSKTTSWTEWFRLDEVLHGDHISVFSDNEGGNIRIIPPETTTAQYWEIDAYNQNLRAYVRKADNKIIQFVLGTDGSLTVPGNIIGGVTRATVTLASSNWSGDTQTVTVTGVLADETKQLIIPTPALASQKAYIDGKIRCSGQAANSLTFTKSGTVSSNITVYVVIFRVVA